MPIILTKKSDTASAVPLAADLTNAAGGAELAVNATDKRLFSKTSGGTVVELGTNPSTLVLPSGSANGVAFLNGSKVVTSGSALVFDGTNLGLGVTPSAWGSIWKATQIQAGAFIASQTNANDIIHVGTNAFANSSNAWTYINTAASTRYEQYQGAHKWFNAPSGTAGNAITFTQAMNLDASGRLGVGTTSPQQKIQTDGRIRVTTNNTNGGDMAVDAGGLAFSSLSTTPILFLRDNFATESARIDSSGNFMIGVTASSNKLLVSGTNTIANFTAGGLSTSAQIQIQADNGAGFNARIYMECPGVNAGGFGYVRSTSRLYAWNQTEDSGPYVSANGTSWTTNSDARLKTNVQNLGYGLTSVLALLPKEYEYKVDEGKKCFGFIAQDVVNVIPELVDAPEDSNEMMGIEYQSLIPVLVKAIQEQQAIINQLKARLDAANL